MRMRWSEVHRKQVVFFPAPDAKRMASRGSRSAQSGLSCRGDRIGRTRFVSAASGGVSCSCCVPATAAQMMRADRRERKVNDVEERNPATMPKAAKLISVGCGSFSSAGLHGVLEPVLQRGRRCTASRPARRARIWSVPSDGSDQRAISGLWCWAKTALAAQGFVVRTQVSAPMVEPRADQAAIFGKFTKKGRGRQPCRNQPNQ